MHARARACELLCFPLFRFKDCNSWPCIDDWVSGHPKEVLGKTARMNLLCEHQMMDPHQTQVTLLSVSWKIFCLSGIVCCFVIVLLPNHCKETWSISVVSCSALSTSISYESLDPLEWSEMSPKQFSQLECFLFF